MRRGDKWNPTTTVADVINVHRPFVQQMIDERNLAIGGPFAPSDPGELRGAGIFRVGVERTAKLLQDDPTLKAGLLKSEIHPWGTGKGVLAAGQAMQ